MTNNLKEKINEFIRYLIIGFSTTGINWGSAIVLEEVFHAPAWLGTVISWIISVIFFAFWAYKFFVFRSKRMSFDFLVPEFIGFVSARLLTLAFEAGFMAIFVDLLGFDHIIEFGFTRIVDGTATAKFVLPIKEYYIFKLLATVVVTILNFIASKFIIFRKGQKQAMLDKADSSNEDEQAEETEE